MYQWYRNAVVCYAYMADVTAPDRHHHNQHNAFRSSRWFQRGWTLQELIAPRRLVFYFTTWTRIGSRSDLKELIATISGIDVEVLTDQKPLASISVSKKMSWLSRRTTTREEDIAYCMLGIFDVNMPLLYGEGCKAFTRLQEEIIKISTDHTIFCWHWDRHVPSDWASMLAPTPTTFANSDRYLPRGNVKKLILYSITNLGLSINLPVLHNLTQKFVEVDVELHGSKSTPVRNIYIPVIQSDEYPTSNQKLLTRSSYPESPMIAAGYPKMQRYNLLIQCRLTMPREILRQNIHHRYGVMLFLNPHEFVNESEALLMPLNYAMRSIDLRIASYPDQSFNSHTGILSLNPIPGQPPQTCCLSPKASHA